MMSSLDKEAFTADEKCQRGAGLCHHVEKKGGSEKPTMERMYVMGNL
jgi:hypothetical protein